MTAYSNALARIKEANLSPALYRTARELLDRAQASNGYIEINHDQAKEICCTDAWGTVRRHLIALQRAGIIQKWLNHSTRVWFVNYPPPPWLVKEIVSTERADLIMERAEVIVSRSPDDDGDSQNDQIRANDDQIRANDDQIRANDDQIRAKNGPIGLGRLGKVGLDTCIDQDNTQPNPPYPPTGLTSDQVWAYQLLIDPDLGVMPEKAISCVLGLTLDGLLRRVAGWWVDSLDPPKGKKPPGVGALVHRLTKGSHAGPISAVFLDSDLYRRHYDAAWEQAGDSDPPQWVLDLPDPPRMLEYQSADGQVFRVPEGRRGGGT